MILPIVKEPTPSLRERSLEVDRLSLEDEKTKKFLRDLVETMYAASGIGIAATQVGANVRVCVIGKDAVPGKKNDLILVNPVIERTSKKALSDTEGCLSVPRVYGSVKRWKDLDVSALDERGNPLSFTASNFFARVIQHEVDHMNGTLFIDTAVDCYRIDEKDTKKFLADLHTKRHG